ncbi:Ras-related protein RabF1 [Tanacetum coccineum]
MTLKLYYLPNLVLLGDSGFGKSCIVLCFVCGQFDPTSKVTVEASFFSQTIALQDSTTDCQYALLLLTWSTWISIFAASHLHDRLLLSVCIVQELQKHGSRDVVLALVGNKADLQEKKEVSVQIAIAINLSLMEAYSQSVQPEQTTSGEDKTLK